LAAIVLSLILHHTLLASSLVECCHSFNLFHLWGSW